jgi:transketolase
MGKNPITIIGVGVGLGYAPAGAAHTPTDDMAYMRSICGIEIYSPATNAVVKELVKYTYKNRKLVYVRLERAYDAALDDLYEDFDFEKSDGVFIPHNVGQYARVSIITSGYLLSRGLKIAKKVTTNLYDLYQLKPTPKILLRYLDNTDYVVTLEEQTLNCGGFSSVVADTIADNGIHCKLLRFGLEEDYILGNGTRDEMLDAHGLSVDKINTEITRCLNQTY